jgi:hypothetical protein
VEVSVPVVFSSTGDLEDSDEADLCEQRLRKVVLVHEVRPQLPAKSTPRGCDRRDVAADIPAMWNRQREKPLTPSTPRTAEPSQVCRGSECACTSGANRGAVARGACAAAFDAEASLGAAGFDAPMLGTTVIARDSDLALAAGHHAAEAIALALRAREVPARS